MARCAICPPARDRLTDPEEVAARLAVHSRRAAAERAQKHHKTVVEFDQTERSRMHSLVRFLLGLPLLFAIGNWMLSKA